MIENMTDQEIATAFQKMSDNDLHLSAVEMAEKERRVTLVLLKHLNEIERRRLYSKFCVSSLHAYCVKELKMDEGTAGRRVSAARLLREIPVIEEKILSGSVTLTSIAQAGIFFRKEAVRGRRFSVDEKQELVFDLENKSTREVDRLLISKSETPEIHFKEKIIPKTETTTEVRLHLDEETMSALSRLKEIWSHANPYAGFAEVIKRAAKEAVEKHDPLKKAERSENRLLKRQQSDGKDARSLEAEQGLERSEGRLVKQKSSSEMSKEIPNKSSSEKQQKLSDEIPVRSSIERRQRSLNDSKEASNEMPNQAQHKISKTEPILGLFTSAQKCSKAEIRREVWRRDKAQCTYQDPRTGERCSAKHFIEEDHILPKAMGGEYTIENIRLRCRAHNQRHAIDCYGEGKMQAYLN